uniref:Uncharacterized protein n=1 Tax=Astyanax mexicanus TaxID=7994 RepID=A0A3B1KI88_ASTMX
PYAEKYRLGHVTRCLYSCRATVAHNLLGIGDQPGQHGETLPLLKIQKLAGRGGIMSTLRLILST